jgi:hypothetical protein
MRSGFQAMTRLAILAVLLLSLSSVSSAYYYWIYFPGRSAPFQTYPAKFDLSALPDKTVSYFISDQPPGKLVDGDNYDALVSQIRLAAESWNGVATSDIRVRFGGFETLGATPQATPGIDVVFDDTDMPPGLLALTIPSVPKDLGNLTKGPGFVPILRSKLQLRSDLTVKQQASYSDAFFLTIVHEFGHTLGLQHSTVSATMSTSITRATTKALPLAPDDIAGISILYPKASFLAATGSIAGRIQLNGNGVNMASVVALSLNGTAIGTLTNPDGTYRIDGIPPGDYYVYTQPLPPPQQDEGTPAAIHPPSDAAGGSFDAFTGFAGQFFPHTRDWQKAAITTVAAGASAGDVNFDVEPRSGPSVYNLDVLGYLGPPGKEAYVHAPSLVSGYRSWMVFDAPGTLVPNSTTLTPGMSLNVIGPAAKLEPNTLGYFVSVYFYSVVDANPVTQPTPVAIAVTTANDLYVLPSAFTVVPTAGPTINSVSGSTDASGNTTVTLAGDNLGPDTRVLFDGAAATSLHKNDDGTLAVGTPPAIGNHVAVLEALAGDGQTSLQTMGTLPLPTFTYSAPDRPSLTITPATVTAGADTMIEVDGFNTNFAEGQTVIGFGSSDVAVRRTWIVDRGKALLNISLSGGATPGLATVTAATGIQAVTLNAGLQIVPPPAKQISLRVPVLNQATGLPGVPAGGTLQVSATGLPADLQGWTLSIADVKVDFTVDSNSNILAVVPGSIPLGPAVLRLTSPNGDSIAPVLFNVDAQPPVIQAAYDQRDANTLAFDDAGHPATLGDVIMLDVASLLASTPSGVHISVGGVDHLATALNSVLQFGLISNLTRIQFTLASALPVSAAADGLQQPVTVRVGTRVSAPFTLYVTPPPAAATAPAAKQK